MASIFYRRESPHSLISIERLIRPLLLVFLEFLDFIFHVFALFDGGPSGYVLNGFGWLGGLFCGLAAAYREPNHE